MLTLGIETSGRIASVAVYDSEKETFLADCTLHTNLTHSQVILPLCKEVLTKAGVDLQDISSIAVAKGPGSYTGLRIGISAVKALSFALKCDCYGISTLEAIASNNIAFKGKICTILKARADLVYTCTYSSDGSVLTQISEEVILSTDELFENLNSNKESFLLCGDGAIEFYQNYSNEFFNIAPPNTRLQNACGVCLSTLAKTPISPDELHASYLQKVKAEKELEDKIKKSKA